MRAMRWEKVSVTGNLICSVQGGMGFSSPKLKKPPGMAAFSFSTLKFRIAGSEGKTANFPGL